MNYNYIAFMRHATHAIKTNLQTPMRKHTLKRVCGLLGRFDDFLQDEAIQTWVDEFDLSKKILSAYLQGEEKPTLGPADELREYLLTYDIKQNEITGEQTISKSKRGYSIEELEYQLDVERYDAKHLMKFLNPKNKNITVVKLFNPLKDLMFRLADNYKGERLISELSGCIPATDFNDKPDPGFYQKRLEYYLRKWLFKAAGQAMGIGKNDAMLLWVEPLGGSGKSYINKWMFSLPEFKNYYVRIGENASFMDMAGLSKGKFAIDWDELPLSKKRYLMFKSSIAATEVQAYSKKTKNYETYGRNVNFIGSTNKANRDRQKGFLLDDDDAMKRRIIPIDLKGRINYQKYTKDIDLYQLWGEAASGILSAQKTGDQKLLTWENDWTDLREQNRRYVNSNDNVDKNIILSVLRPSNGDNAVFMSASEVLDFLSQKGVNSGLTPEKVGRFLKRSGFSEARRGNSRGYEVSTN